MLLLYKLVITVFLKVLVFVFTSVYPISCFMMIFLFRIPPMIKANQFPLKVRQPRKRKRKTKEFVLEFSWHVISYSDLLFHNIVVFSFLAIWFKG